MLLLKFGCLLSIFSTSLAAISEKAAGIQHELELLIEEKMENSPMLYPEPVEVTDALLKLAEKEYNRKNKHVIANATSHIWKFGQSNALTKPRMGRVYQTSEPWGAWGSWSKCSNGKGRCRARKGLTQSNRGGNSLRGKLRGAWSNFIRKKTTSSFSKTKPGK